jgi:hypothetical protein
MTRGNVPKPVSPRSVEADWAYLGRAFFLIVVAAFLVAASLPLVADPANPPPSGEETFGAFLSAHQDDLAPVFSKNSNEFFRLAVPQLMGLMGWVILVTMLVGWVIDLALGYGFAFFFAPAFTGFKRATIYATGRVFLSFIYTALLGIAIVFSLSLAAYAGVVMAAVVILLLVVSLAAQVVWILYLYRSSFWISVAFYLAVAIVHTVFAFAIAKPIIGLKAKTVATDFMDRVVTPKLQAEAETTKHDRLEAEAARKESQTKVSDLQTEVTQVQMQQDQASREIEAKKNSDVHLFGEIIQTRARNELDSARTQLVAFLAKFPTSSLAGLAHDQLTQVNIEIAANEAEKKQVAAAMAEASAQSRADLLARAAKGEVTLSEMRQVLLGKSRTEVSDLLGQPSQNVSENWVYQKEMILNPLTKVKYGLMVYFSQGTVQGVDYQNIGYKQGNPNEDTTQ